MFFDYNPEPIENAVVLSNIIEAVHEQRMLSDVDDMTTLYADNHRFQETMECLAR